MLARARPAENVATRGVARTKHPPRSRFSAPRVAHRGYVGGMKPIQDYYDEYAAHCYGCGPASPNGMHIRSYVEGDEVVMRYTLDRELTGGVPEHAWGGIVAAILDCHAAAGACAFQLQARGAEFGDGTPIPRFVTGTFTIVYKAPTPLGVELIARARLIELSGRKAKVSVALYADDTECVSGEMIAIELKPDAH